MTIELKNRPTIVPRRIRPLPPSDVEVPRPEAPPEPHFRVLARLPLVDTQPQPSLGQRLLESFDSLRWRPRIMMSLGLCCLVALLVLFLMQFQGDSEMTPDPSERIPWQDPTVNLPEAGTSAPENLGPEFEVPWDEEIQGMNLPPLPETFSQHQDPNSQDTHGAAPPTGAADGTRESHHPAIEGTASSLPRATANRPAAVGSGQEPDYRVADRSQAHQDLPPRVSQRIQQPGVARIQGILIKPRHEAQHEQSRPGLH